MSVCQGTVWVIWDALDSCNVNLSLINGIVHFTGSHVIIIVNKQLCILTIFYSSQIECLVSLDQGLVVTDYVYFKLVAAKNIIIYLYEKLHITKVFTWKIEHLIVDCVGSIVDIHSINDYLVPLDIAIFKSSLHLRNNNTMIPLIDCISLVINGCNYGSIFKFAIRPKEYFNWPLNVRCWLLDPCCRIKIVIIRFDIEYDWWFMGRINNKWSPIIGTIHTQIRYERGNVWVVVRKILMNCSFALNTYFGTIFWEKERVCLITSLFHL